jgi:hypothetical protein
VICLAGDGGFAMLLGDLLTTVQESLPIKIVVFDNGKLGFVDIEQKAAGLIPLYTDLKNPDFGEVAKAMGLWGHSVSKAGELEESVRTWLAEPGPALLHVKVKPMQLVMPPSPLVSPESVVGMAVYSARALLHGKGHDVWEMVVENFPCPRQASCGARVSRQPLSSCPRLLHAYSRHVSPRVRAWIDFPARASLEARGVSTGSFPACFGGRGA